MLEHLAAATPGAEGKWFAAAKDAGLYEEALQLASRSPCDPRTLTRAARDYAEREPAFAMRAGELALGWLALGHGYEITGAEVLAAYRFTLAAADRCGCSAQAKTRVRDLVSSPLGCASVVAEVLRKELGTQQQ